jgi:hypothetical protein
MPVLPVGRTRFESGNTTYQAQDGGMKQSTIGKEIEHLHSASPASSCWMPRA